MDQNILQTPIEYLKTIGTEKASLLRTELGITKFEDLLYHFPYRYINTVGFQKISDLTPRNDFAQLKGKIIKLEVVKTKRVNRLVAIFSDGTGRIELVWFRAINKIKPNLVLGKEITIFGKVSAYMDQLNIAHPEIEDPLIFNKYRDRLKPMYSTTEKLTSKGLSSKGIERIIKLLLQSLTNQIEECLSDELLTAYKLPSREQALLMMHLPKKEEQALKAVKRFKFEELFFLQLKILKQKITTGEKNGGLTFSKIGDAFNQFYNQRLPFELTNAQKKVLKEIRKDLGSGLQMVRLLQGDVGSGKTIVATLAMLIAIDNGFQTTLMAPTEILAKQHFAGISELLDGLPVSIAFLSGSTKASEKKEVYRKLQDGEIDIVIGTHALIQKTVNFKNLGLTIIDEQHRFGVAQRSQFWKKNNIPPHSLVMTATPIPRTLAMTLYGDLEVSVIDELPPGRKSIKTLHFYDSSRIRLFGFIEEQIKIGRQIYVVYPLIEESEKLDLKDLMDGYESLSRRFPLPKYRLSIVHGKMKPENKEAEMQQFVKGQSQIMVATTVIEVGVNVPNASVMIIENAERFGLSQLHQLRGRVGRGAEQSYCILMSSHKLSQDSKERIKTMLATNDGFKIAEADLKLRGPGDFAGTQQSGVLDLKVADLTTDAPILTHARNRAKGILTTDPNLELDKNKPIRNKLITMAESKINWTRIA